MKNYIFILTFLFSMQLSAQNCGQINGVVYSADTAEVVPFTRILLINLTDTLLCITGFDGKYKFSDLSAGIYTLMVRNIIYNSQRVNSIIVRNDTTVKIDIYLYNNLYFYPCRPTICRFSPFYFIGNEMVDQILRTDIKNSATVRIEDRLTTSSSEIKMNNNALTVRGTRPNDLVYYIDGVRQSSAPIVPRVAVRKITYFLGGLPAKYGETTSGAVVINSTSYFDLYYDWKAKQ